MTAPTSYTENTLKMYLHRMLGRDETTAALNWDIAQGDFNEAVDETLLVLDTADISTISGRDDIRKLRAVARCEMWRSVMTRTVHRHQRGIDQNSRSENQIWEHAKAMYDMCKGEAIALGVDDYDTSEKPSSINTAVVRRGYEVD